MFDLIVGSPGALLLVGSGLFFIFCLSLWLPFNALKIGWLWAIAIFLFAPLGIIFAIKYWPVARRPVLFALYSLIACVGIFLLRAYLSTRFEPY